MPSAYVLTTQAQVDYLRREFPHFTVRDRYVGYEYGTMPVRPHLRELQRRAARARYQNHYEPEILPLP